MEILTLLKASIRSKKGLFVSTVVLVFIITATAVSILSAMKNHSDALAASNEFYDTADLNVFLEESPDNAAILEKLGESPAVERYSVEPVLASCGYVIDGENLDVTTLLAVAPDKVRVFNEDFDAYLDDVPELGYDDLFITFAQAQGLKKGVGDKLTLVVGGENEDFTVAGVVEEPFLGASAVVLKLQYVSRERFDAIAAKHPVPEGPSQHFASANNLVAFERVSVYESDKNESGDGFMREVERDTGLISASYVTITKDDTVRYTGVFLNLLSSIMLGFSALLFVIVLVVVGHSIRIEIKIDYENLGVLKSQGVSSRSITIAVTLRYLLAELLGLSLGTAAAFPLERVVGGFFMDITAILPLHAISVKGILAVAAPILALSALTIFLCTRTVAHISPIKAIKRSRGDVYFDEYLNLPINKRCLSLSLAMRGVTSAKKRYISLILITALLTSFMVTVNVVGSTLHSRSALEACGNYLSDIDIYVYEEEGLENVAAAEAYIDERAGIKKRVGYNAVYASVDGVNMACMAFENTESVSGMLKGRPPKYDNEIIVTPMVSETFGVKIGDEVEVANRSGSGKYVVTGLFQTTADAGKACLVSMEGAKRLGVDYPAAYCYYVDDVSNGKEIADHIKENYPGLDSMFYDFENDKSLLGQYDGIVFILKAIVYGFSVLFTLVSVLVICSMTFAQERSDIGVYKSLGFTSRSLRRQFAMRFFLVTAFGGLAGSLLSLKLAPAIMNAMFGFFGIVSLKPAYSPAAFVSAILFVSLSVLLFSYFVSGRIKRVAVRELITE